VVSGAASRKQERLRAQGSWSRLESRSLDVAEGSQRVQGLLVDLPRLLGIERALGYPVRVDVDDRLRDRSGCSKASTSTRPSSSRAIGRPRSCRDVEAMSSTLPLDRALPTATPRPAVRKKAMFVCSPNQRLSGVGRRLRHRGERARRSGGGQVYFARGRRFPAVFLMSRRKASLGRSSGADGPRHSWARSSKTGTPWLADRGETRRLLVPFTHPPGLPARSAPPGSGPCPR
jgi:hypothetical protein